MKDSNGFFAIGRIASDIELKTTRNGSTLAAFRFVFNRSQKVNGKWEDKPVFIDAVAFDGDTNRRASIIAERCQKGSRILLTGGIDIDEWEDKTTGNKRSKHKITIDDFQIIDSKKEDRGQQSASSEPDPNEQQDGQEGQGGNEIPF